MESNAYIVFSIIYVVAEVSIAAKILYFLFFQDRLTYGEITEKQSPTLAGKRYIVYSQIIFLTKGYICETPEVEEYFRSKNKKVLSQEDFEKLANNKARKIISMLLWGLGIIVTILKIFLLFIWNLIKKCIPYFAKMVGMDADTIKRNKRNAYLNSLYHHPDSLSKEDKEWLKF